MRITIATGPCLPAPPLRGGGMIRTWMALARVFASAGHEVTLLARAFAEQPRESLVDGFRILRWGGYDQPRSTWISLLQDLPYAWGACRHLPQADILVTNDFWLPFFAPILSPTAGRVVVSVNRYPKRQLDLYQRASQLVVPTRALAQAIQTQSPDWVTRTTCIANPFDGRAFHLDATVPRDPASFLYVGRLHPEKGVDLLLDAFRELHLHFPAARLTLAGPHAFAEGGGGDSYLGSLQKKAAHLPVRFTGPIHQDSSLAQLYQSHLVFCYPSLADRGEAMGIAPLESMACGCVPVVSANPVFKDWLKEGINGWSFDHHSPQRVRMLADKLRTCLANPQHVDAMRHSAIETAEDFEASAISRRFLEMFARLLHEHL